MDPILLLQDELDEFLHAEQSRRNCSSRELSPMMSDLEDLVRKVFKHGQDYAHAKVTIPGAAPRGAWDEVPTQEYPVDHTHKR